MPKTPVSKTTKRSENAVLDQGIAQLLRGIKDEKTKIGQPINREQLQKEGFSERFIEKVERA